MDTKVCPTWAQEMIAELYALETSQGHIIPMKDSDALYHTKNFADLIERMEKKISPDAQINEDRSDYLFEKIVNRLTDEGFQPEHIAQTINQLMPTRNSMKYCDASSVIEILEQK